MQHKERYNDLFAIIEEIKPKTIMEVGVRSGGNAIAMIKLAQKYNKDITYYGFDLFEFIEKMPELKKREFIGTKKINQNTYKTVKRRIFKATGAHICLFQGLTQKTIPVFKPDTLMDFIFLDAGHLTEPVRADWNNSKRLMHQNTVVVFDDYLDNYKFDWGCQHFIAELKKDKNYVVTLLPTVEYHENTPFGNVYSRMVKVQKWPT